jgi:Tol biopolymer transport system component
MPDIGDIARKERPRLAPVAAIVIGDLASCEVAPGKAPLLSPVRIVVHSIRRIGDDFVWGETAAVIGPITAVRRVSTGSADEQANSLSRLPIFSPDGTKVAFSSDSSNLVPDDTNGSEDVFVKDLITGAIMRVSTSSTGEQSNRISFDPDFSSDGTKVAFASNASNLVPGDTNFTWDIFVKDIVTGAISRVSTSSTGTQGYKASLEPVFSPAGSKFAFSSASHLVPGDTNHKRDVFVKDIVTGAITRVSTSATGEQANNDSYGADFSPDGNKLAFSSVAPNLVGGDTNRVVDVFVKDLVTGTIMRASTSSTWDQGNSGSATPKFSPDGTKLVFGSGASNLIPEDTNGWADVFVKDLTTGIVVRVSTSSAGEQSDGPSFDPHFSPDGGKVTFTSGAHNLVPEVIYTDDIYVKDLVTGAIARASSNIAGEQASGFSESPSFSPDGTEIAFASYASNLVLGDTNSNYDVFVVDLPRPEGTSDRLIGGRGRDHVFGSVGNDVLVGGPGGDRLSGGHGRDRFTFTSIGGSTPADPDWILDLNSAKGDVVDLLQIDAVPSTPEDDAFTFIGSAPFAEAPGSLRFANGVLEGDIDGDDVADLLIRITVVGTFGATQLVP